MADRSTEGRATGRLLDNGRGRLTPVSMTPLFCATRGAGRA